MFCPNCGAEIEDNVSFCMKCGREIPKAENAASVVPLVPAAARAVINNTVKSDLFLAAAILFTFQTFSKC